MSFILLGILNSQASAGIEYWLSLLSGSSTEQGFSIGQESDSFVYSLGDTNTLGAGSTDFLISKHDSAGIIQWQRTFGGSGADNSSFLAINSSGVYAVGRTNSAGSGALTGLIAKYDFFGAIQWQRILGGADTDLLLGAALDSSNNLYAIGNTRSLGAGGSDVLIAKYDSSGTIQWQRILGGASNENGRGVGVDGSGNVYIVGNTSSAGAGLSDCLIAKYDSSGTIQWQRILGDANNDNFQKVAIAASGNVYASGQANIAGSTSGLIAKYDSSGTLIWQRAISGALTDIFLGVALDNEENIYAVGQTSSFGAGANDWIIAKYDSSGNLVWQRTLGGTGNDVCRDVTVDSRGALYLVGDTTTSAAGLDFFMAKLPSDGSLSGTYSIASNTITYQASTLTAITSTLTAATPSLTAATSSLTSSAPSLTDAAATLTSTTLEI